MVDVVGMKLRKEEEASSSKYAEPDAVGTRPVSRTTNGQYTHQRPKHVLHTDLSQLIWLASAMWSREGN